MRETSLRSDAVVNSIDLFTHWYLLLFTCLLNTREKLSAAVKYSLCILSSAYCYAGCLWCCGMFVCCVMISLTAWLYFFWYLFSVSNLFSDSDSWPTCWNTLRSSWVFEYFEYLKELIQLLLLYRSMTVCIYHPFALSHLWVLFLFNTACIIFLDGYSSGVDSYPKPVSKI